MRKVFVVFGFLILISTTHISAQEKVSDAIFFEIDDFLQTGVLDLTDSDPDSGDFSLDLGVKYGIATGYDIYNQSHITVGSSVQLGSAVYGLAATGDINIGVVNFRFPANESKNGTFFGFEASLFDMYYYGTNYDSVSGVIPFWDAPNICILYGLSFGSLNGPTMYLKNAVDFTMDDGNIVYVWTTGVGFRRNLIQK
jgi:hypothetical protein